MRDTKRPRGGSSIVPGGEGTVGVNIGANKDSADRFGDYELGVERFAPLASYLTVNISSPNTPGLRDMQARASLAELLSRVVVARDATIAKAGRKVPLFLKIAPDLHRGRSRGHRRGSAGEAGRGRHRLQHDDLAPCPQVAGAYDETGGLSGKPLFERSTIALAKMRKLLGRMSRDHRRRRR